RVRLADSDPFAQRIGDLTGDHVDVSGAFERREPDQDGIAAISRGDIAFLEPGICNLLADLAGIERRVARRLDLDTPGEVEPHVKTQRRQGDGRADHDEGADDKAREAPLHEGQRFTLPLWSSVGVGFIPPHGRLLPSDFYSTSRKRPDFSLRYQLRHKNAIQKICANAYGLNARPPRVSAPRPLRTAQAAPQFQSVEGPGSRTGQRTKTMPAAAQVHSAEVTGERT